MNERDIDEQLVLGAARRAMSPSASDQTRVRLATAAALTAGATAAKSTLAATLSSRTREALTSAGAWGSKTLIAATALATSASAGYYAGLNAGRDEARAAEEAAATPSVRIEPKSATPPVPGDEGFPAGNRREPPSSNADPIVAAQNIDSAPAMKSSSTAHESPKSTPPQEDPIKAELRSLRRIERALRTNNAKLALVLLDELDASGEPVRLGQERAAARAVATCLVHPESKASVGSSFSEKYPKSVYLPRIEQACDARAVSNRALSEESE